MKVGIAMFPADFAVRPDVLARAVEERGFDSLFFPEHTHMPATETHRAFLERTNDGPLPDHYSHTYDLFVALSYAAAATERLLLGTGICLVPQREPIATAKAVASLDALSGGRVLFGVGAGWIPEEIANHGVEPSRRWAVMAERVKAMRAIWSQDVAEFHGEHVDLPPITSWPKPAQRPHPPVLVGGEGKGVERRVLDFGDEWLPHDGLPLPELTERIAALRDRAREQGRATVPVTVFGAKPDVESLLALREAGATRVLLYAPAADEATVLPHLDRVAPLVAAVA